jgi:cobalt-zinc-cadmium efflux system outer membrane protein
LTPGVRSLFVVLPLLAACAVPRGAGFDDVKRLVRERGIQKIYWKQGGQEDDAVENEIDSLLSRELTPASVIEITLLENRKLQATYERLGVAQAELVQAGLLKNPFFFAHIGIPVGKPSGTGVAWEFSIVQEFIDLFLIPLRKRLARAEFERVKLEVADQILDVTAAVRTAYYTAVASQIVAEVYRVTGQALEAAAEISDRQAQAGATNALDAAAERSAFAEARLTLLLVEERAEVDRERLTRLLGLWGHRTRFQLPKELPTLPGTDPSLEKLESFAVTHRLDLASLRQEMAIASAALSATKATRFIGSLELGADAHREPEGFRVFGPSLRLDVPIFDQGQAKLARLLAEYRRIASQIQARAVDIRSEVRESRIRLLTARRATEYFRTTLLPLREEIVALSQKQYNSMQIGVFQLLQAKNSELASYRQYVESLRDYWIARAELERVAGGKLPDEDHQGERR